MKNQGNLVLTLWAFVLVLIAPSIAAQSTAIVIKAGKLLDPATGIVSTNQVIIVAGGKIQMVSARVQTPEDAVVWDLSKSTVMPGLFDAHTHLCATVRILADRLGLGFLDAVLLDPAGYRAIQGVVHAREMLDAGFTTVRDVGNAGRYVDVDLRRAISEGLVAGPTMIVSGRIIAPFGGQFSTRAEKHVLENPEYVFADTRDEMRKAIRENVYYGADVIKIVVDGRPYQYTTDDIRFIVAEAANADRKVAAHVQTARGARNAIAAGVASIEHGWMLSDDDFELMKRNQVALVGTDTTEKVLAGFGWDEAQARRINASRVERLRRAYQGGVTIVFGTDVMVDMKDASRGALAIGYIDSFIEAGIPPKAILQMMTAHAARLLGVERVRGSIAPGMAADLIATSDNPLENIQTLKQVSFVMKNGRVHKH